MSQLFEFTSMAFPKAGVEVGQVPLTLSIVLYGILLIKYVNCILKSMSWISGFLRYYLFFSFMVMLITILNFGKTTLFHSFVSLILVVSPMAIVLGQNIELEKAKKILAIALFIVGMYAIIQWFFGIKNTAINGINITYGDDFFNKPIGWGVDGREAIKMPTTYQNGNSAAVFYSMVIPIVAIWRPIKSRYKVLKLLSATVGVIGLAMSGSRSIIVPFVICIPMFLKLALSKLPYRKQKLLIGLGFIIIPLSILYIITSNNDLIAFGYDRYILQLIQDSTGAGRTTQVIALFRELFNDGIIAGGINLMIGFSWDRAVFAEGIFYLFSYYGIFVVFLMTCMFICTLRKIYKINKIVFLGLFCSAIAFIVDTSYCYIPVLINFYFVVGLFCQEIRKEKLNRIYLDGK
jgi:hypothetical protein